jgi:DNA-directed RNA polymerase subunit RPC12/RpoP
LNKYLEEGGKKKSLAKLTDEELAQLSPEELEEARKVRENLLVIKQTTQEVESMENQKKWAAAVQYFADTHDVTVEEAEHILRQRAGLERKALDPSAFWATMGDKPNSIEKALSDAIAANLPTIAPILFGHPPSDTGGKTAQSALTDALQQAKAFGAQSIYLPDGSVVKLAEDGGGNQDAVVKSATSQIQKYVEDIITQRLPTLFSPQNTGLPQIGKDVSPEYAKLVLEDKWHDEDRKVADLAAERRDLTVRNIAAALGAIFSPEGFAKMQSLLKTGPLGEAGAGIQAGTETAKEAKMLKVTCWKCLKLFPYEEGQDPVCPYCGQAQKVQCPKCEHIFTPTNRNKIECPNCHAELQPKPVGQGQPQSPKKETPEESAKPSVSVGSGLE